MQCYLIELMQSMSDTGGITLYPLSCQLRDLRNMCKSQCIHYPAILETPDTNINHHVSTILPPQGLKILVSILMYLLSCDLI